MPRYRPRRATGWRTAVILPDQQIGYRSLPDRLQPFHDPRALDVAEKIVAAERPDLTVMLGDLLDFPAFGRFRQEPGFATTSQAGLDRAAVHVATVAALSGETRIIEGNHDARIQHHLLDNALAAAGLQRTRRNGSPLPVLSVPYLLAIEEMHNVRWIGGYPAGATYINDGLAAIHGRKTGANYPAAYLNEERVSIVAGHTHAIVDVLRTRNDRDKPRFSRFFSPGCLCRIDGTVPSFRSGASVLDAPPRSWENWQQGLAVVRYDPDGSKFAVEMVPIFEGWAMHRGQVFTSAKGVEDA